jgi:histidine triad (HIT) family protein
MVDCIFCKIIDGKIPATIVYEDDNIIGFKDLSAQAPVHLLFIHRKHTKDINDMAKNDPTQLSDLFHGIRLHTEKTGLNKEGFRVVTNQGPFAGQTVFHTHLHVLGGGPLGHFGS